MATRYLLFVLYLSGLLSVSSCMTLPYMSSPPMSSGGVRGLLYHNVTLPFDVDVMNAKVTSQSGSARITRVREPFTAFGLSAEEGIHGIADAARGGGISTIHLVDMRSRSVAFGLWQRKTVIVWGE